MDPVEGIAQQYLPQGSIPRRSLMDLSYGKLRDPAACSTLVGVSTERKSQCLKAELGPLPG